MIDTWRAATLPFREVGIALSITAFAPLALDRDQ
jgi:hypothetical protein